MLKNSALQKQYMREQFENSKQALQISTDTEKLTINQVYQIMQNLGLLLSPLQLQEGYQQGCRCRELFALLQEINQHADDGSARVLELKQRIRKLVGLANKFVLDQFVDWIVQNINDFQYNPFILLNDANQQYNLYNLQQMQQLKSSRVQQPIHQQPIHQQPIQQQPIQQQQGAPRRGGNPIS